MPIRRIPNLTPEQVVKLQDALLANADTLLKSALALLDRGYAAPARSLAILGLEESGKAVAIHNRRVAMASLPDGESFRCEELDEIWSDHEKKLQTVYAFLVEEPYWFDVQPSDPDVNASFLGTIRAWTRQDRIKQRGFYVDLDRVGDPIAPEGVADEAALRDVIAHVHQIGWQLRLGEHIEGKLQDEGEAGSPPMAKEELAWLDAIGNADGNDDMKSSLAEIRKLMSRSVPDETLPNSAYRFNPPGADRSPFRNLGKVGYEAETREIDMLATGPDDETD